MAISIPPPTKWSAKQQILAALAGIIAVTVVVIMISVSLRPAHLRFSIANAGNNCGSQGDMICLNLTLAANNTSHRTGVHYEDINVQFWNTTDAWSAVVVSPSPPFDQPPQNSTAIQLAGPCLHQLQTVDTNTTKYFNVLVTAQVWFKVGRWRTRKYNVRARCYPVKFEKIFSQVNCSG